MTRETKIGLLVGLAFIIVIGILLSDHVTNSTEPPGAQLAGAGPNVRSSVNVPGSENPPVTQVTPVAPPPVTPEQPVPTQRELAPRPQVVQVEVGPGANGNNPAPVQVQTSNTPAPTPPADPAVTQTPPAAPPTSLEQVAQNHNEQIVPANPNGSSPPAPNATASTPANLRQYKAEPGDTLSKMAGRFMGANTKANREAIIRANPSLQADPDRVVAGRTYLIPAAPTQNAQATTPASPTQTVSTTTPRTGETTYTTKEGDSLWRIAEEQLGDGRLYTVIKEMNKDVLKGGDTVKPGMVLRLPGRQVASAE